MREEYSNPNLESMISEAMMPSNPRQGFKEELMRQLSQYSSQASHGYSKSLIRKWLPATALVLMILAFLLAMTNPEVAAAMRRLFKFLPGIGVVDTSQFKVLDQEVTVERDGITLTVSAAAGDTQRTRILLDVEGPLLEYNFGDFQDNSPFTREDDPFLILPDNSIILIESAVHHGDGSGRKYIHRLTFPPLPEDVMEVTLAIPRIFQIPPGAGAENWFFPTKFKPGDPEALNPVFEVEGEQEENFSVEQKIAKNCDQNDCGAEKENPAGNNEFNIKFNLDRVAELDDGYILMTKTTWDSQAIEPFGVFADFDNITDANGQLVTWDYAESDQIASINEKISYGSFKIEGKNLAWPITIKPKVIAQLSSETSFIFDAGDNPHIGDNWQPDLKVSIPPFSLNVFSVEAILDDHGGAGYVFSMQSNDIFSVVLMDKNRERGGAGGGGGGGGGAFEDPPYLFESALNYFELPKGSIEVSIGAIAVKLDGEWQVTWQPE